MREAPGWPSSPARGISPGRWDWIRLFFLGCLLLVPGLRADYYVAPDGSDDFPGSVNRPFATVERAQAVVRTLKINGALPRGGLTVWLYEGDYPRTNALELTEADSGTSLSPITWRAQEGARVRWLGGRRLSGFIPVTNAAILTRLPESARTNVLELNLRSLGLTNFGALQSRGFARATTPAHSELFFNGQPMTLARWPNEGSFEKIAGFPPDSSQGDDHGGNIGGLPGGFLYAGDRPRTWQDPTNAWVHGYWAWDWANSYERIANLDLEKRRVLTAPPHGLYGFRTGQRFYFLNILEELDQPGEWFLETATGVLYFWPPSPPQNSEILLSLLDQPLIRLQDVSHLTLRGFIIEGSRGNGVELRGGTSNRLAGITLRNLGNNGVTIDGGRGHTVISCNVFDTGDGGVTLSGGNRQTLESAGHLVENCHFQRQGRWSKCYVPAVLLRGVGHQVRHNLIQDHPHCAIQFTGNDHLIEYNEIHHVALETGDVGAIYSGRDYSFRGNRIRFNYLHETGGVGMGSMGVYLDDCVSGVEVYGNLFYKVHWAVFIGGGRDHRVENNLFVDCDPAVRVDGRGLDKSPVWRDMVNIFMRQQLAAVPAPLYRERYPALKSLDRWYALTGEAFQGVPPEGNVVKRNLCYGPWLDTAWNARLEDLQVENNIVVNPAGGSAPQPPLLTVPTGTAPSGFEPIPRDRIGLQKDADRPRLPLNR